MNRCNDIIEHIYTHPRVNTVIRSIKPTELQEELKQELAVVLLTYDCDKLIHLHNEGKLLNFALGIVWKMGTLQNGNFYKTFKKNEVKKAIEYLETFEGEPIPEEYITEANNILHNKLSINANEAHESIIFSKYVELQSCQKVATYFMIPRLHVFQVVNKVKKEIKKQLQK